MTPAFQRTLEGPRADCFEACLASLLNLPTEAIPLFGHDPDAEPGQWIQDFNRWLAAFRLGLIAIGATTNPEVMQAWPEAYCILAGDSTSPLGGRHAVVGRVVHAAGATRLDLVHDPFLTPEEREDNRAILGDAGFLPGLRGGPADWLIFFLVATEVRSPAQVQAEKRAAAGVPA